MLSTTKDDLHKKVDFHFSNLFNSTESIINSLKPNSSTVIEDVNCLELNSSVLCLTDNISKLLDIIYQIKVEALTKQENKRNQEEEKIKTNSELDINLNSQVELHNIVSSLSNDIKGSKFFSLALSNIAIMK